jgi:VWFA-related protein
VPIRADQGLTHPGRIPVQLEGGPKASRSRHEGRYVLPNQAYCRVKRYCPFLAWGLALAWTAAAQSSTDASPAQTQTAPSPAPAAPDQKSAEVATHDTPATFKVRVNLVLARVVVRDEKGNVVENLHREDFALADNRKPQVISFFSMETPAARPMPVTTTAGSNTDATGTNFPAPVPAIPQRFVNILYDDVHMSMQDALTVRTATTKLFGALAATDRVGIFTTSGQTTQDFTSDHEAIKNALNGIIPKPLFGHMSGAGECPDISYYQADLIMNKNDQQAMDAAVTETIDCAFNGDTSKAALARAIAMGAATRALTSGDAESEFAYRHIEDALRRLTAMPGQRVMVFVSPGFILAQLFTEASGIIDRATRANIVIDTIDARGLYTPDVMGDIADPPGGLASKAAGIKVLYRTSAQAAQSEILDEFAAGTGGTYFHNRNDLDAGLRQAVAAPAVSYVLGFSPQNLKLNGGYHTLKVTLTGKQKYSVQARRGYFAPRKAQDPTETAKQEIQEAIFSQDEIGDLPVDLQTQFFKAAPSQAKLSILAHLDLKSVRFRKADGRNRNDITLATAIFDENGNLVTGGEKIVEMRLLDGTRERLERSGINVKSSFDVKPGSYLVRLVVRDAEGEQMAAKNGAVVIPN